MDVTSPLMTMSSCLSLGSNLELRWWKSALVVCLLFFFLGMRRSPLAANGPYCDVTITPPLVWCILLFRKIKEMNAGATSRALPMGKCFPLKAWQGKGVGGLFVGGAKTKTLLYGFSEEWLWVQSREWVKSLFFVCVFFFPFSTTHPSLALWVIIEKNLYSYSLFHPDSIYSSNNNISYSEKVFQVYYYYYYFFDLQKTAIQHNTKKGKETKRKTGHKTCKKPTTIAPNLPTTHSEYRFQQNCH